VRIDVPATDAEGHIAGLIPAAAADAAWGTLGSRKQVEAEIDLMLTTIRAFYDQPGDVVMRQCGALSARCTELAIWLVRLEGRREWIHLRTRQIDRLLAEIERQYRIASRLLEGRRLDWETSRENSR
jgi:hypothetical protein